VTTFHIDINEIAIFFSILLRISLLLFMIPLFTGGQIPNMVKAGVSLALGAFFFPFLRSVVTPLPLEPVAFVLVVLGEILLAMVLSLSMLLVLAAFHLAGEIISVEMGLGFAQVVDPQGGAQVMVLSRWFNLLAVLLLFSFDGHHMIIQTIVESFRTIPMGGFFLKHLTYSRMVALSGYLFVIALKIAAPVLIVLMLMNVALGLIAKFSPQINILTTSFPLTIFLGLLFMGFSVSVWGAATGQFLMQLMEYLRVITG
jgi:flagellar biosynthetic protein FliR